MQNKTLITTTNSGLASLLLRGGKSDGTVLKSTFVLRIKCSAGRQFCASYSSPSQSPKPFPSILNIQKKNALPIMVGRFFLA